MTHIKQLDAVRAIAVILVLIWHGFPETHVINRVPNGVIGVNMFFVLSGFLITRILMEEKIKAEKFNLPRLTVFKNFFFRRALRIFPIYYLLIFVLWIANSYEDSNIEANIGYFLSYTSNFYFYSLRDWDGLLSHTWTLAIEEQFYLLWPWTILFISRRFLLPLIVLCIAIGTIAQYVDTSPFSEVLPHTCLHAFGMGGLLAWIMVFRESALPRACSILTKLAIIAILIFAVEIILGDYSLAPVRMLTVIITGGLITYILYKGDKLPLSFSFVLNNKQLIFLGKISYGIYLYHPIFPRYTYSILNNINKHIPVLGDHLLFIEQSAIVIAVACISWFLIERPILTLKKHFVLNPKAGYQLSSSSKRTTKTVREVAS